MEGPPRSVPVINADLAARFLSRLTAPLTSLTLGQKNLQDPPPIPAAAAAAAGRLARSLATFTQLRCLSAVLPTDERGHSSVREALVPALPAVFAALHQLQSIAISADAGVVEHLVPLLTVTTLTHLRLRRGDDRFDRASEELLQCACRLKLQDCSLQDWADRVEGRIALTQLTALSLHGCPCLLTTEDWETVASMTCLQSLCFQEPDDGNEFAGYIELEDVALLHSLSAITSLTFMTSCVNSRVVVSGLELQPLTALQVLKLALYDPFDTVIELCDHMSALPRGARVDVDLRSDFDEDFDEEPHPWHTRWIDDEAEFAEYQALARLHRAKDCLYAAAAQAGIKVSIAQHGFMPAARDTT